MKYKLDLSPKLDFSSPPVTGTPVGAVVPHSFLAWQPSTWPAAPASVGEPFIQTVKRVFEESMLVEIGNVISDAHKSNGDLQHRGHVVAISLMCALDAISSYGYTGRRGGHIAKFVRRHFPPEYHPYAQDIYRLYRNSLIHSWNLFKPTLYPGNEPITKTKGLLSFGLLSFFQALQNGTESFLNSLDGDKDLQTNTLNRYTKLRSSARS